jgi:Flp pilus assembly protein TadD
LAAVIAALVVAGGSLAVDVGGARADRSEATLAAAAARSWSAEAGAALGAGVPEEAVRLLRSASMRCPSDPVLQYRLGLAEKAAGRTELARAAFARAVALSPTFVAARDALKESGG